MAGSKPFDPSSLLTLSKGSRLVYVNTGGDNFRWIYNSDGIDDFWTMPPAVMEAGDTVEFDLISAVSNGDEYLFCSPSDTSTVLFKHSGADTLGKSGNFTLFIDGVETTVLPKDGLEHTILITFTTAGSIVFVGSRFSVARTANFPIYNISIKRASLPDRFYPVDDGWANNPRIRDTLNPMTELLMGRDYSEANNATVSIIVNNSEWDIQTPSGAPSNSANGGAIQNITLFQDGVTYDYSVDSSEDVNVLVYDAAFNIIASGVNRVTFTATATTSKIYVCPRTTNTVRVSAASITEYTDGTAFNFNEERWTYV